MIAAALLSRRRPWCGFLLVWSLLVASCAPDAYVLKPVTLQRQAATASGQESAIQPEKKTVLPAHEFLSPPVAVAPRKEKQLPPGNIFDPRRITVAQGNASLNAEKMPLSDFVIYAIGETLKVSFVMDDKTMNDKRPVTLRMPQPLPTDKVLEIVIGLLEKHNLYLEEKAGALYILHKPPDPKAPFDVRVGLDTTDSPVEVLQVVPLKHVRINEIDSLIRDMFKAGVQVRSYKDNIMLLYGRSSLIRPIMEFIEAFDVPSLQHKRMFLMRLTYWQPDEFIAQLSRLLEGIGITVARAARDAGVLFMSIKQTNSILVVSPDEITSRYVLEWRDKLDTLEAAGTEEKTYTYQPLYSRASQLVESIQKLYGVVQATAPAARPATAPAQTAGAQSTGTLPGLKIAADDNRNIIIIASSPPVYKNVLNLLKGLDTPPKQVLLEATIAELTLTGDLKYGLEWYLQNSVEGGTYMIRTLGQLGLAASGLTASVVSGTQNFRAMLNAFASTNKANILSTPRLTVLDNREATIQIGQDVPVVTGEVTAADVQKTTTGGASSILRNIQYRSTGIILKVKPTINTEGLLTLEISQEVSDTGAAGAGDSPIILMRRISTSVVVGHGQTLALGGLMKENKSDAVGKIPILGDIPLIGHLFKVTTESRVRTELLVLVTPTIITSLDEASQVTRQLKGELKWLK